MHKTAIYGIIITIKPQNIEDCDMPYIKTFDRDQMMFCSWDSFVAPESTARIIDAFIDSLDL